MKQSQRRTEANTERPKRSTDDRPRKERELGRRRQPETQSAHQESDERKEDVYDRLRASPDACFERKVVLEVARDRFVSLDDGRTSRISFDDVEKNKSGVVRGEDDVREVLREKIGFDLGSGCCENAETGESFKARDVASCEIVVKGCGSDDDVSLECGEDSGSSGSNGSSARNRFCVRVRTFPKKRTIWDRIPFFGASSSSSLFSFDGGNNNAPEQVLIAQQQRECNTDSNQNGKRFGFRKRVIDVNYETIDEALVDLKRLEDMCGLEHQKMNRRGKFLVFINPAAGRGKAEEVFKKHVEPVLTCVKNCTVEAIVTERRGETEERTYERSKESMMLGNRDDAEAKRIRILGIIAIGGDGTIAEAYAGVERAQKEIGARETIPIGAIPAGSGNAICVSLAEQSQEVNDATTMALLIAKGQTIQLDGARLAIYKGTSDNDNENNNNNNDNKVINSRSKHQEKISQQMNATNENTTTTTTATTNRDDGVAVYQNTALLSISWGFFADVDLESERFRCLGGTRFIVQAIARLINLRTYKMDLTYKVSRETREICDRLGKPLPGVKEKRKVDEFRTMKNENILGIWAMNLPWGSGDTKSAPLASPSDGFFDIIIVHPTSKLNLLKLLLDFDTKGTHAKNEAVTYLKTSEFELCLLGRSDATLNRSASSSTLVGCVADNDADDNLRVTSRERPSDLYEGGRVMIDGEVVPNVCSRDESFVLKGKVKRGLAAVFSSKRA